MCCDRRGACVSLAVAELPAERRDLRAAGDLRRDRDRRYLGHGPAVRRTPDGRSRGRAAERGHRPAAARLRRERERCVVGGRRQRPLSPCVAAPRAPVPSRKQPSSPACACSTCCAAPCRDDDLGAGHLATLQPPHRCAHSRFATCPSWCRSRARRAGGRSPPSRSPTRRGATTAGAAWRPTSPRRSTPTGACRGWRTSTRSPAWPTAISSAASSRPRVARGIDAAASHSPCCSSTSTTSSRQRHARPPGGRRAAAGGGQAAAVVHARAATPWRAWAATSSRSCCTTPPRATRSSTGRGA